MSKEYYTKAEVNKLLADQKEEILAIIPKFAKHQEFDLKIAHPGLLARNNEIERLRNLLLDNYLIEFVPSNLFAKVFMVIAGTFCTFVAPVFLVYHTWFN